MDREAPVKDLCGSVKVMLGDGEPSEPVGDVREVVGLAPGLKEGMGSSLGGLVSLVIADLRRADRKPAVAPSHGAAGEQSVAPMRDA